MKMLLSTCFTFVLPMLFFSDVLHGQKQCDAVIDLMLIVDSSGSIRPEDFERSKLALIDLVGRLNVAAKKAGVAIINFATNMTLSGQTDVYEFNQTELLTQIGALVQIGTRTATGDALALARSYCEASCRDISEGIPRVFVIITDGHSNIGQEPIPVANSLRTSPTEGTIFAIGIGDIGPEGQKELLGIADDPDYVLSIGSYLGLLPITNAIARKMCDFPAFVVPNRMIQGQVSENQSRYYKMNTLHHVAKSALFEIRLSHLAGRTVVYTSTKNKKPMSYLTKTLLKPVVYNNTYTVYVPASAKAFYFSVKGVMPDLNRYELSVRVRALNF